MHWAFSHAAHIHTGYFELTLGRDQQVLMTVDGVDVVWGLL